MVHKQFHNIPPSFARIDVMSRAIRTRSYQALLAQSMSTTGTSRVSREPTQEAPPSLPAASNGTVSPIASPVKSPKKNSTAIITPSLNPGFMPGLPGLSRTSSASSLNPHITDVTSSSQSKSTVASTSSSMITDGHCHAHERSSPLKRSHPHHNSHFESDRKNDDSDDELPSADFFGRPIARIPSPPPAAPPSLSFLDDHERTFHIYFNLWQVQCPENKDSVGKKRKKTPGGSRPSSRKSTEPKYKNYAPKLPIKITLKPKFYSFDNFRKAAFEACNKHLPGISEVLERAWSKGTLSMHAFVNASAHHKSNDKAIISNPVNFLSFVHAALTASSTTIMGCRIMHEDPRKAANAIRALEQEAKQSQAQEQARRGRTRADLDGGDSSSSEGDDLVGSVGSEILSPGERNLRTLMKRFSKDFKKGENVTSVPNPRNAGEILLLNTARIRTWANNWADGVRGVDDMNPPMSRPGFEWIPVANYERAKNTLLGLNPPTPIVANTPTSSTGTIIHHNYYGQPSPLGPAPFPGPIPPNSVAPTPPIPAGTSSRLSPPPGDSPAFEDFLLFAGIRPEMERTRRALANEGIEDFARLLDRNTYTLANFRSMGIPFAHAEDLWKAVPKFILHLRLSQKD